LLGAALVVYLGIKGGGYDVVIRSEVGVAVWWLVLLGALVGVLPAHQVGRSSWAVFGLLAALAAWSVVGTLWSESSERSVLETGRIAMYLGVFALCTAVCSRDRVRPLVNGVACGLVAIAAVAVLSRLHPAWFPADAPITGQLVPGARSRLSYPLNYWNGLAALVALALPIVLSNAVAARSIPARCAATGAIPLLGLCWYLTISRGGALAVAAGALAFLALSPRRVASLLVLAIGAGGSAILIAGVEQRHALGSGIQSGLASHQGDELLVLLAVVCAGVALLRLGTALAEDHALVPAIPRARPRTQVALVAIGVVAILTVALAAGASSTLSERWDSFKNPSFGALSTERNTSARFSSGSGNGRYQYWKSAVDAFETQPLRGIGAGTFEFWWARHATLSGFVRNAHSLLFETLAESGVIGIALVLGLFGTVLVGGVARIRRSDLEHRALLAGAVAGCVAFFVSAAVDWVWQVAVLPVCFFVLAAAVLSASSTSAERPRVPGAAGRVAAGIVALAALAALALPLSGAVAVRDSQGAAQRQDITAALASASTAARVQPYAGTPELQRALVLELDSKLEAAATAARAAERREPTNWRPSLVLARIEAERGHVRAAVSALGRARALNKTSPALR
jgi:O-Antigen ligase